MEVSIDHHSLQFNYIKNNKTKQEKRPSANITQKLSIYERYWTWKGQNLARITLLKRGCPNCWAHFAETQCHSSSQIVFKDLMRTLKEVKIRNWFNVRKTRFLSNIPAGWTKSIFLQWKSTESNPPNWIRMGTEVVGTMATESKFQSTSTATKIVVHLVIYKHSMATRGWRGPGDSGGLNHPVDDRVMERCDLDAPLVHSVVPSNARRLAVKLQHVLDLIDASVHDAVNKSKLTIAKL